jgi:glycerophosphoryl diester phosphodiesterase
MNRRKLLNCILATPLLVSSANINRYGQNRYSGILVEAHRGNSISAPENTLVAIKQALEADVDRVEIDLQFSKDQKLVVIHDDTVDRTTNGSGNVSELHYEYMKTLDAGSWKSAEYKGEKIPLLNEVFELCKGKAMVNIDLKNADAVPSMVKSIIDMDMENEVVITGKIPEATNAIRKSGANITMFYESSPEFNAIRSEGNNDQVIQMAITQARKTGLPGFLFHAGWITKEIVYIAHLHGLAVNVYDVNTPEQTHEMIAAGVDGIMTDDPMLIRNILNDHSNN